MDLTQDQLTATAAIRAREAGTGRHTPIIALTAFGRPEDRQRALAEGFDAYLKKPVDPAELAETVREIVHPDDEIRVKILEIDSDRRRLSLSAKRVEDQRVEAKLGGYDGIFFDNIAGDPTTNLYKRLIDSRTREFDLGAQSVFGDVDEEFAWTEGEGDRSLAHWRSAHLEFFASQGVDVSDDDDVVLERFELLWRAGPPISGDG